LIDESDTVLHNSANSARLLSPEGQHHLHRFAQHIASALSRLHEVGYVHFDLKPQNVVLTGRLDELDVASAVIVDLGSARVSAAVPGATLAQTGTREYMSPEVFFNKPTNEKADVWSFGIMLWEMFQVWDDPANRGRPKPRALDDDDTAARRAPVPLDRITNALMRNLAKRCLMYLPEQRETAANCARELTLIDDADRRLSLDVDTIVRYVEMRIDESETIYKCGFRRKMLDDWRRVALVRQHARDDLKRYLNAGQVKRIAAGIRSGRFILDNEQFGDLHAFAGTALDESMKYGIYVWRNSRTGQGYVGKIERENGSRRQRDLEHRRDSSTAFDRQLDPDGHGKDGWLCVSVAQTSADSAGRAANARLEVLLVLLLNTYSHRDGFNSELGGVWGATQLHRD
jgi:hypothetical protein